MWLSYYIAFGELCLVFFINQCDWVIASYHIIVLHCLEGYVWQTKSDFFVYFLISFLTFCLARIYNKKLLEPCFVAVLAVTNGNGSHIGFCYVIPTTFLWSDNFSYNLSISTHSVSIASLQYVLQHYRRNL